MDIQSIVAQLRQEASRIEHAIAALAGLGSQPARRGRPPKGSQAKPASGKKRRHMSAAARKRKDVRAAGVCWAVLHDHHDDPPGSALALRFLGAVHRIVLQQLAACYPSAGGDSDCDDPWPRFHAVVQQ